MSTLQDMVKTQVVLSVFKIDSLYFVKFCILERENETKQAVPVIATQKCGVLNYKDQSLVCQCMSVMEYVLFQMHSFTALVCRTVTAMFCFVLVRFHMGYGAGDEELRQFYEDTLESLALFQNISVVLFCEEKV